MNIPGDRRPSSSPGGSADDGAAGGAGPRRTTAPTRWLAPRPARRGARPAMVVAAIAVALVAATGWAILRGILELGPGSLVVAALGGWGIGAALRPFPSALPLAGLLAFGGWLTGLVLTWLLAMALLPGSTRTFLERVEGTPFLDWLLPQFGILELAGLVAWVAAALYAARPARRVDR